jgi:enoyl-CoA hydratase/carnithine racemase
MPDRPAVSIERAGQVTTLKIDRPERRNALDTQAILSLSEAMDQAKHDSSVKVLVITGAGEIFSAGGDLDSFRVPESPLSRALERRHLGRLLGLIDKLGKPIVARVNGDALGLGLGLVAACDLAVACREARFGLPGIHLGIWPMTILAPLQRTMPRKILMDLLLTGRLLDSAEAAAAGFVNAVVERGRLDQAVEDTTRALTRSSV